jgi:PKD repeat protein
MKRNPPWLALLCTAVLTRSALGVTHYVNLSNPAPSSPYTSWATASANIQNAIDVSSAGDLILVTNGLYQTGGRVIYGTSNRVAVTKAVAVQSVNGPATTVIQGWQVPGTIFGNAAVRCVYLTNNASLSGFTLSNGATWNTGDSVQQQSGGAVWCASTSAVVSNCVLVANAANFYGGGAYSGTIKNCMVASNLSSSLGGGISGSTLINCALVGNSAGSAGGGAYGGYLSNCTVTVNSAGSYGGGFYSSDFFSSVNNSILFYNAAPSGANYSFLGGGPTLNVCCTTPRPAGNSGNISLDPQLASLTHLSASSPCRSAGSAAYASGVDIDGEVWGNPPSIGCDQYRAGSVTGPLNVSIQAAYTNAATGFAIDFAALIDGRTSVSQWDFGDGTVVSNRPITSHSWSAPGNYSVLLQGFNESNPSGVSATVTVTIVTPPIHYVSLLSSNPVSPYSSWDTAATSIHDAIDAASLPGAIVMVGDGLYATGGRVVSGGTSNRVAVTKPLTVQSASGPVSTLIQGYQVPGSLFGTNAVRCVYLTKGAALVGFTLTNGATRSDFDTSGGGALCAPVGAALCNCLVASNAAYSSGGGAYQGTLNNCAVFGNFAAYGGGIYQANLTNCTVTANTAFSGGGAHSSVLNNCIVFYNSAASSPNYSASLNFCCASPLPPGTGNIGTEPQLSSLFHVAAGSPCLGLGNVSYITGSDIDGEPWSNPPAMGCDEYQTGAVTGPLTVSILAPYTNVATGFTGTFTAWIFGKTSASRWDFGDSTVASNRPVATHSWSAPGDYPLTLQSYNEDNPLGVSATIIVHVVDQPVSYVALESTNPVAPYSSWATAATSIQDAVDASFAGGTVIVSDGVYQAGGRAVFGFLTNRVAVTKPLKVQSVNGPAVTVIQGAQAPGPGDKATRCVYLADSAALAGFTLTNGATRGSGDVLQEQSGAGAWCWSGNCVVSNCLLTGNAAAFEGGGGWSGVFRNCTFWSNSAAFGGGGDAISASNCVFSGNQGSQGGATADSSIDNSVLTNNYSTFGGGALGGSLRNCLIVSNASSFTGGGTDGANLNSCTVVGNSATTAGGGAYGGFIYNTILFYNTSPSGSNFTGGILYNCCTTPLPSSGSNSITNQPALLNLAGGNFRLQSNSPCINSGYNGAVASGQDLDGDPRIVRTTVDIGAYEFQAPLSLISYAWLQQYGLATDGSADFADADGDGMNNWEEWVAGTDPINPLSSLALLNPSGGISNIVVRWQSVPGRAYFLQRATNLAGQPPFLTVASNLQGQTGFTTFTDRQTTGPGPFFYRVGVQQ